MLRKTWVLIVTIFIITVLFYVFGGNIFKNNTSKPETKKLDKIKLAYKSGSAAQLIYVFALQESGALKKYGIELESVGVDNITSPLASNSVDVILAGGIAEPLREAVKGINSVWIAAITNNEPDLILARVPKEKIRKVATTSFGSNNYIKLEMGLKSKGIDTKNITYVLLTDTNAKMIALEQGSIDAVAVSPSTWETFRKKTDTKDIYVFFDFSETKEPFFPRSVITTSLAIEIKRDVLVRLLEALLEGQAYTKNNPEKVADALVKKYQLEQEKAGFEVSVATSSARNLIFTPRIDLVKKMLSVIEADTKEAKTYGPNKFVDDSLAKEAMGLVDFKKIQSILNE